MRRRVLLLLFALCCATLAPAQHGGGRRRARGVPPGIGATSPIPGNNPVIASGGELGAGQQRPRVWRGAERGPADKPGGVVDASLLAIPAKARDEYRKGMHFAVEKHNHAEAAKHFRKAVKIYPSFAQAWAMLGVACLQSSCAAESETDFKQAIAVAPRLPDGYVELARFYRQREDVSALREVTARLVEVAPGLAEAHYYQAYCLLADQHPVDAEKELLKARDLMGGSQPEIWLALAWLYEHEQRLPEAAGELRSYLRAHDDPEARSALMRIEAELNRQTTPHPAGQQQ